MNIQNPIAEEEIPLTQQRVLRDDCEMASKIREANLGNVDTIDFNRTRGKLHQAVQRSHNGGFPGARPG